MLISSRVDAEQASRATEERTDGAGLLVAEAAKGANNRLHSRAPRLLSLLFSEDLLDPSRFSARHVSVVMQLPPSWSSLALSEGCWNIAQ